jgi:hypothetical protein
MRHVIELESFSKSLSFAIFKLKSLLISKEDTWPLSVEYELINLELLESNLSGSHVSFYRLPYFQFLRTCGFGKNSKLIAESMWGVLVADHPNDARLFERIVASVLFEVFNAYKIARDLDNRINDIVTCEVKTFVAGDLLKYHAEASFSGGRCGSAIQREATCFQHERLIKQTCPALYELLGWGYELFLAERFGGEMVTRSAIQCQKTYHEVENDFAEQWELYLSEIANRVCITERSSQPEKLLEFWSLQFDML